MDSLAFLTSTARNGTKPLRTIEMHTCGEPTRIVYEGYPDLRGTLLERRAEAKSKHDGLRRALICEPRGHREMYGAVLMPKAELEEAATAALFLTNDGYSTMCGHATLAIARLVIDTLHTGLLDKFLDRSKLHFDLDNQEVRFSIHVPCGLVHATVPYLQSATDKGVMSVDQSRPISYLSVPSYAPAIGIQITIPRTLRWPELDQRDHVTADIAYGGGHYIICSPAELGFSAVAAHRDLEALSKATRNLKQAFNESDELREKGLSHLEHQDLRFLYGTIVTDSSLGAKTGRSIGAETGICFFSDAQVDRSPTGSGVQARVALAFAKGERKIDEDWTYHSPVSNAFDEGSFVGTAVEEVDDRGRKAVVVRVSGFAKYTGAATYVLEENDRIGMGFWFDELKAQP